MGISGCVVIFTVVWIVVTLIRRRNARIRADTAEKRYVLTRVAELLGGMVLRVPSAARAELIDTYRTLSAVRDLITDIERTACLASDPEIARQSLTALAAKLRAEANRLHG